MPADFWQLTPYQFNLIKEAAFKRKEYREKRDILHAWTTAMLTRASKFPKLEEILPSPKTEPGENLSARLRAAFDAHNQRIEKGTS